ncbi:MAG: hypothetical protein ACYC2K_04220 [Gemmatimonadales bacterium]
MTMPRSARLLMVLAALCVGTALAFPLWEVRLVAPQYPEGLGLRIHAHTVAGIKPNDLTNINNLNHYIGMRPIEPDAIPELRWLPGILLGLAGFALVAAAAARRRLLSLWLSSLVVLAVLGVWDFWRWGRDYGHNLDTENAIIVVPGMTYQPPVIGRKHLLNFTATAWPAAGTGLLGAAFLLGVAARRLSRQPRIEKEA